MKKNTIWIIVVVIILVILGIIFLSSPKTTIPGEETVVPEGSEQEGALPEQDEEVLGQAEAIVPDASPVSKQGEVLTQEGKPADNTALPGSPDAPKQSRSLEETEVPENAVKLTVSATGFLPNEFTVNAGEVVTLSVTSEDKTHVFKFDGASLQGVAVGVAGSETRAITFNAPEKGDYTFYCDVPGHRARGETGVMHVK